MLAYALLLAVTDVRIVDDGDSGWTIAAALGTVFAVIVALIVPLIAGLLRRCKSPKLGLRLEGAKNDDGSMRTHELSPDDHVQNTIWVAIGNAQGRNRAEGVELFASIDGFRPRGEGEAVPLYGDAWVSTQAHVSFSEGRATSTVPANYWRRARLGVVKLPTTDDPDQAGEWCVAADAPRPIHPGMRYEILLTFTADHLDARSYFAELTVEPVSADGTVSFCWTKPAKEIKPGEHPRLRKIEWK
jgi:hypothetical protein